jgi:hypothetical protein
VRQKVKLTKCIRRLAKTSGIVSAPAKGQLIEAMVRERFADNPMLTAIIEPMLVLLLAARGATCDGR